MGVFLLFFHFFVLKDTFLLPAPGPFSGNEELEAKNRWAAPSPPQLDNQTRFWGFTRRYGTQITIFPQPIFKNTRKSRFYLDFTPILALFDMKKKKVG